MARTRLGTCGGPRQPYGSFAGKTSVVVVLDIVALTAAIDRTLVLAGTRDRTLQLAGGRARVLELSGER